MNIVLIGMRGSGKTSVGSLLAEKLGRRFIEMDEMISEKAGMSIAEIAARYGWPEFRKIEAEVTRTVAAMDNAVNATGGGVVTSEENVRELKRTGKLVWLRAELETLRKRIQNDPPRPSLTGRPPAEDMAETFAQRQPIYERSADFIVETDNATPPAVADEITRIFSQGDQGG